MTRKIASPILFALLAMTLAVAGTASSQDIETITHGKRVDLASHLVAGKLTLFDFYADWCGPCRALAPQLEQLAAANPDTFAIRKIDIVNWDSEVTAEFRIQAIPHLKLFDQNGALIGEGEAGQVMRLLVQRLDATGPAKGGAHGKSGTSATPIVIIGGLAAVAIFFLLRGRGPSRPPQGGTPAVAQNRTAATGSGWFVMIQNSLEGPFSEEDLEDMVRRRVITSQAKVRRRGDAEWQPVGEVIAHLT